ncbi:protein lethal(2)essential for life [Parasteatoda tepidariorum]|uniref:protein lethal(2)essential for life n=1 Tax=Parasteatoda tepidariorum TaxID=114398 RepID=UPI00077FB30C|nr:protein lethal(2)essential for life [Parasteatoda tepidariorum]
MLASRILRDLYDPFELRSPRLGLFDDYFQPAHIHLNIVHPRRRQTSTSSTDDSNNFKMMLNVKHFRPDEIDVKTVDDYVVVRGKHEEQADEHGFVSREFTRRYKLPDDVEPDKVVTSLSQDGILTIKAPRKQLEPPPKNERVVPITIQKPAVVEEAQKQQQMQEQASAEENK